MRKVALLLFCAFFQIQIQAEVVTVAAAQTVEPFIVEYTDSGFEIDIVREAFALEGDKVKFIYQPLLRTKLTFQKGIVDGVLTVKDNYPEVQGFYLSDEYISYDNFAISLQSQNLKIDSVADLKDKTIVAFQQANYALGRDFELIAETNPGYRETANQNNQISQFFARRSDVIVLDRRIFLHHLKLLHYFPGTYVKDVLYDQPVIFHDLFEPSHYKMAFSSAEVRNRFNRGLRKIRESGRYQQIIDSYMKE